jgi:hypothetical protein
VLRAEMVDTAQEYAGSGSADSIGVDADDDGTFESYLYPSYIQKGTNITLTVAGDTLTIAGSGGSGDDYGVNFGGTAFADSIWLKNEHGISLRVDNDTGYISIDSTAHIKMTDVAVDTLDVGTRISGNATADILSFDSIDAQRINVGSTVWMDTLRLKNGVGNDIKWVALGGQGLTDSSTLSVKADSTINFDGVTADSLTVAKIPDGSATRAKLDTTGDYRVSSLRVDSILGNTRITVIGLDTEAVLAVLTYDTAGTGAGGGGHIAFDDSTGARIWLDTLSGGSGNFDSIGVDTSGDFAIDAYLGPLAVIKSENDGITLRVDTDTLYVGDTTAAGSGSEDTIVVIRDSLTDVIDTLDNVSGKIVFEGGKGIDLLDTPGGDTVAIRVDGTALDTVGSTVGPGTIDLLGQTRLMIDSATSGDVRQMLPFDTTGPAGGPTDNDVWAWNASNSRFELEAQQSAAGGDANVADTAGDGTNTVDMGSPTIFREGTNITLTVTGDTIDIAGPAASGTADSVALDTSGSGDYAYLYSTSGPVATFHEGAAIDFTVDTDTGTIAVDTTVVATRAYADQYTSDSIGYDIDGGAMDGFLYPAYMREGNGIIMTVAEDTMTWAASLGTVVDGAEITDGSVDSADIAANAIRSYHIANGAVDSSEIPTNAIRAWHTKASMWGKALERNTDSIDVKAAGLKGLTITSDSLNVKVDAATIAFNAGGELEIDGLAAGNGLSGGDGSALAVNGGKRIAVNGDSLDVVYDLGTMTVDGDSLMPDTTVIAYWSRATSTYLGITAQADDVDTAGTDIAAALADRASPRDTLKFRATVLSPTALTDSTFMIGRFDTTAFSGNTYIQYITISGIGANDTLQIRFEEWSDRVGTAKGQIDTLIFEASSGDPYTFAPTQNDSTMASGSQIMGEIEAMSAALGQFSIEIGYHK